MKSISLGLLGAAALPLALGAYVRTLPGAPAIPTVTVTATDYAIEAPDTLPAGAVELRLVNRGKEFHHLWVARLEHGRTASDLMAALRRPGPLPSWVRDVGGPNAPAPGGESNATVSLAPGTYTLACLIPSKDGVPHLMKGMIHEVTVVETGRSAHSPVGDVTMTLHDYSFALSQPLVAGTHTIEVRNEAAQNHEIELIQLAPGKTAADVVAWLKDEQGPLPGRPIGGVAPLASREVAWFRADFEPGRYLLICFVPDEKDGKSHFMHGMMQELEVPRAKVSRLTDRGAPGR